MKVTVVWREPGLDLSTFENVVGLEEPDSEKDYLEIVQEAPLVKRMRVTIPIRTVRIYTVEGEDE